MARYPIKKDTPGLVTEQAKTEQAKTLVRAIYGRMVDPTDGGEYEQTPRLVTTLTKWVKSQIAAGKMELV